MKTYSTHFKLTVAVAAILAIPPGNALAEDNDLRVYWKDSLRLESGDGKNKLRIGGRIHWDNAFYGDDEFAGKPLEDGDVFRRARLYLSGQIQEHYDFKMQYDFAKGSAAFKDVYFGIRGVPGVGNLRMGQFKEPFSLEELASSNDITFIERAMVNRLAPSRSAGLMLYNDYARSRITGAVGLFRGQDDKWGNYRGDGYAATARVTGLPYHDGDNLLHLGAAYSFRDDDSATYKLAGDHALAPSWKHSLSGLDATHLYGLEAALKLGPFSLQTEWAQAGLNDGVSGGLAAEDYDLDGFTVQASYVLTGESRSYDPKMGVFKSVKPAANFLDGGAGAWELTLRYSDLDYSDLDAGAEMDTFTVGLNWYLNKNVRALLNYTNADTGGAEANLVAARLQIAF